MKSKFSKEEIKFLIAIGLVMGMRELSMSMLSPFITVYGKTLVNSTTFLCGLAMGIYGLTNGLFQIPYGIISDKYGRKPIILLGLFQLSAGLFLGFLTSNIYTFIFARALQGSGAVMAIAYSWLGDGVANDKKSSAMGIAGIIVAIGAVAAFALGPLLYKIVSIKYMFLGCSAIVMFSLIFILFFIKEDYKRCEQENSISYKSLFKNSQILRLSFLGFIFNYVMSEMFFVVPTFLNKSIGGGNMWIVFTPAVIIGILTMVIASKKLDKGCFRQVGSIAFTMMLLGTLSISIRMLAFNAIGTVFIFSGFMVLTSGIPSEVNKIVKKEYRGGANGILQTLTFFGFFVGPTLTGLLLTRVSHLLLQVIPAVLCCIGILLINIKHNAIV